MNAPNLSTAVDRALSILELVSGRQTGLSHSQICRRLEIPKSTASYLLRTLVRRGYLRQEAGGRRFLLGLKVVSLAHGDPQLVELRQVAEPAMKHLADANHHTARLAVRDRDKAVSILRTAPTGLRLGGDTGALELHASAAGKALICRWSEEEVAAFAERHGLPRHTPKTLVELPALLHELAGVRAEGYAVDDEESRRGLRSAAAPVYGSDGEVRGALELVVSSRDITADGLVPLGRTVRKAALLVSQRLGYQPSR